MESASVTENFYSILGVSKGASSASIRESYKKLALKFHPDKNKEDGATSAFQRLSVAWDTLKDKNKRAEYDRQYGERFQKRQCQAEAEEEAARAKRRREEVDHDAMAEWIRASNLTAPEESKFERERPSRARAWKKVARQDYMSRLQAWTDFQNSQISLIRDYRVSVEKHQLELDFLANENEKDVIRAFEEAIELSCSSGHEIEDRADTMSKLLEARKAFVSKLMSTVNELRERLHGLEEELESEMRQYEEEEATARQERIREASEILGPLTLSPPFQTMIGRKGQVFNRWKALSRIRTTVTFSLSLDALKEGPWHKYGAWEHIAGEHTCGRCAQSTFHLFAECGPAKCPGCGMVVCNDCFRSLFLLREYEAWIVSADEDVRDSPFSLDFDHGARPLETANNDLNSCRPFSVFHKL